MNADFTLLAVVHAERKVFFATPGQDHCVCIYALNATRQVCRDTPVVVYSPVLAGLNGDQCISACFVRASDETDTLLLGSTDGIVEITTAGLFMRRIALPARPMRVAYSHGIIAVTFWPNFNVSLVSYGSAAILRTIYSALRPDGVAFTADGTHILVSNHYGDAAVHSFCVSSSAFKTHTIAPPAKNITAMVACKDGGFIIGSLRNPGPAVVRVDVHGNAVVIAGNFTADPSSTIGGQVTALVFVGNDVLVKTNDGALRIMCYPLWPLARREAWVAACAS